MANSGSVAGVFVPYTKWKKLISDGNTNLTARLEGDVIVQAPAQNHVHPLGRPVNLKGPLVGVIKVFRGLALHCLGQASTDEVLDLKAPTWVWQDEGGARHGPWSGSQLCGLKPGVPPQVTQGLLVSQQQGDQQGAPGLLLCHAKSRLWAPAWLVVCSYQLGHATLGGLNGAVDTSSAALTFGAAAPPAPALARQLPPPPSASQKAQLPQVATKAAAGAAPGSAAPAKGPPQPQTVAPAARKEPAAGGVNGTPPGPASKPDGAESMMDLDQMQDDRQLAALISARLGTFRSDPEYAATVSHMELDDDNQLLPGSETSLQHLPDLMEMEWEDNSSTTTPSASAAETNTTTTTTTSDTSPTKAGTANQTKTSQGSLAAIARGKAYGLRTQVARDQALLNGAATQSSLLAGGGEGEGGGQGASELLHLFLVVDTCVLLNPHGQSLLRSLQAHFAPGARRGASSAGEGPGGTAPMDTGRRQQVLQVSVLVPRRVLSELDGIKGDASRGDLARCARTAFTLLLDGFRRRDRFLALQARSEYEAANRASQEYCPSTDASVVACASYVAQQLRTKYGEGCESSRRVAVLSDDHAVCIMAEAAGLPGVRHFELPAIRNDDGDGSSPALMEGVLTELVQQGAVPEPDQLAGPPASSPHQHQQQQPLSQNGQRSSKGTQAGIRQQVRGQSQEGGHHEGPLGPGDDGSMQEEAVMSEGHHPLEHQVGDVSLVPAAGGMQEEGGQHQPGSDPHASGSDPHGMEADEEPDVYYNWCDDIDMGEAGPRQQKARFVVQQYQDKDEGSQASMSKPSASGHLSTELKQSAVQSTHQPQPQRQQAATFQVQRHSAAAGELEPAHKLAPQHQPQPQQMVSSHLAKHPSGNHGAQAAQSTTTQVGSGQLSQQLSDSIQTLRHQPIAGSAPGLIQQPSAPAPEAVNAAGQDHQQQVGGQPDHHAMLQALRATALAQPAAQPLQQQNPSAGLLALMQRTPAGNSNMAQSQASAVSALQQLLQLQQQRQQRQQQQQQQHALMASSLPNLQEHQPQPQAPVTQAPVTAPTPLHLPGQLLPPGQGAQPAPALTPQQRQVLQSLQQLLAGQLQNSLNLGSQLNHNSQHTGPPASQGAPTAQLESGVAPAAAMTAASLSAAPGVAQQGLQQGMRGSAAAAASPAQAVTGLLLPTVQGMPGQVSLTQQHQAASVSSHSAASLHQLSLLMQRLPAAGGTQQPLQQTQMQQQQEAHHHHQQQMPHAYHQHQQQLTQHLHFQQQQQPPPSNPPPPSARLPSQQPVPHTIVPQRSGGSGRFAPDDIGDDYGGSDSRHRPQPGYRQQHHHQPPAPPRDQGHARPTAASILDDDDDYGAPSRHKGRR